MFSVEYVPKVGVIYIYIYIYLLKNYHIILQVTDILDSLFVLVSFPSLISFLNLTFNYLIYSLFAIYVYSLYYKIYNSKIY